MQIEKCITISSEHISLETSGKLDVEPAFNEIPFFIFKKSNYGWWINIDPAAADDYTAIPADLMSCILYAWKHDCTWLCLDADGEIISELPVFNWDDPEIRTPVMKKFKFTVTETLCHTFYFYEENVEEAIKCFDILQDNGRLDFSCGEIVDSTWEVKEMELDETDKF